MFEIKVPDGVFYWGARWQNRFFQDFFVKVSVGKKKLHQ